MEALTKIYWTRVALGAVAGLLCTGLLAVWPILDPSMTIRDLVAPVGGGAPPLNTLLNGITIALFVYIISYYVIKAKYATRIEKQSKLMSMGIFIYFFTWIIVWVLSLTAILGPL
ncbi:MAG: hypothetical protein NWF05_02015 [Candidatus Bathyarchaeota archaeon]|nr:hypothetical protein [Candidatus Bathyarchaeota archaeon]